MRTPDGCTERSVGGALRRSRPQHVHEHAARGARRRRARLHRRTLTVEGGRPARALRAARVPPRREPAAARRVARAAALTPSGPLPWPGDAGPDPCAIPAYAASTSAAAANTASVRPPSLNDLELELEVVSKKFERVGRRFQTDRRQSLRS